MAYKTIRLVSWNVNGLRAVLKKDFHRSFAKLNADVLALQQEMGSEMGSSLPLTIINTVLYFFCLFINFFVTFFKHRNSLIIGSFRHSTLIVYPQGSNIDCDPILRALFF